MSSIERARGRATDRMVASSVVLAVLLVACGGDTATDELITTVPTETSVDFTETSTTSAQSAVSTSEPAENGGEATGSDCPLDAPASCGGSAVLVFDGETVVFDFFACYFDDDAEAVVGDAEMTFAALGQVPQAGGTASVVVNVLFSGALAVAHVIYVPGGDPGTQWQGD